MEEKRPQVNEATQPYENPEPTPKAGHMPRKVRKISVEESVRRTIAKYDQALRNLGK